ncbi:helix-turn-helix transcriptional regulator [Legionella maioricensis]|uniref:LuxR family transcriptional regulator n=1 Tax=Legionella maioricensis TaxID=2896528 RepID=A0A9X2D2I7_9GAMM|nr:LuxR family transcriptional regulator [Legionella maioricensis]MCL9685261.1 LuxR family transcriptional regulator [Legionella maioricensis]MCL9688478.1 LuxR family transcriptional regulator [Legionella maioricensis]
MMHEVNYRMSESLSVDALKQILIEYFAKEGITSLAFTFYKHHTKTGGQIIYDWVSPPLRPWHQHYLEQKYADIDRTLESSERSLIPVYWDVHQQLTHAKNSREQRIRKESIDFGIDKGLNIPVHGSSGDLVVLVLHQRVQQNGLELWQNKQYHWMAITQCYFHYLRKLLLSEHEAAKIHLTNREQQCLELTAQGFRIGMIAENLGITQRTCNFHLQNANKKLGVANKYLAATRWLEEKQN